MAKRPAAKAATRLRSKALAHPPPAKREPKPKPVIVETLEVPAAALLAAESVAAKVQKERTSLQGVLIHQVDDKRARVVATDGVRLFVASFHAPREIAWLKEGLFLRRDALKARVSMITKVEDAKWVYVSYAPGAPHAELSDPDHSVTMKVGISRAANFPHYTEILTEASFTTLTPEGEDDRRDWQAVGFNSRSLRYCGDIAKILEGGMEKAPKEGIVIRAFSGANDHPKAFDFPQVPGALLVVMPVAAGSLPIPTETAPLLATAARLTVAALRAHATRWRQRAAETPDAGEKQDALDRAAGFDARVEAVIAKAPALQAQLEGPAESPPIEAVEAVVGSDDPARKAATVH